jgi:hypothetical protein
MSQLQGLKGEDEKNSAEEHFKLYKGVLYKKSSGSGRPFLLVIPSYLRRNILEACHDDPTGGHQGITRTYERIKGRYFWKGMIKSVKAYVNSCVYCQFHKPILGMPKGFLCPIPPPKDIFDTIGIDHLGPFQQTARGNKHLLVAID